MNKHSLGAHFSTRTQTFTNPIVDNAADPWVLRWRNLYYYCRVNRCSIWVSEARQLQNIGQTMVKVWHPRTGTKYSKQIWAPELHHINNNGIFILSADNGNNINHRMYVLESDGSDPEGRYHFKGKLAAATDRWAIDGTVLNLGHKHQYFIWSGWLGKTNTQQNLYIAKMKYILYRHQWSKGFSF